MKVNRRLFSAADRTGDKDSSSLDCCFLLLVLVRFAGAETAEERTTTTTGRGRERWRGLKGRAVWVKKWVDIDEGVDKSGRQRGLRSEVFEFEER
jgi:hypothetical protein